MDFVHDLRLSLRQARQQPGFFAAAATALALGVGANTAIFSLVNTVLLKPPPYPDSERIVLCQQITDNGRFTAGSPAKFGHWLRQDQVVKHVSAFRSGVVNWTGTGDPVQLRSAQVSRNFFALFGVPVLRGRTFSEAEDQPRSGVAAIITEALWRGRFASDPKILERSIELGGVPHPIIGITGAGFDFSDLGDPPDVYVPFQLETESADQGHYFHLAGRLAAGLPVEQARSRIEASSEEYKRRFPGTLPNNSKLTVVTLREELVRDARSSILVLWAAVGFVLLIACANVANLLLARAIGRKREFALRAALGAGRGRLIRQLLVESLLLGAVGSIAGAGIGLVAMRALLAVNRAGLPRVGENGELVSIDARVLGFTVLMALATSLLFGIAPALRSSRAEIGLALKEGGRAGSGFRRNRLRTLLAAGQLAFAVVLVTGAGLMIRTMVALGEVQPGFDASNVLTMRMSLSGPKLQTSAGVERLIRDGVDRVRALPMVEVASASCCVPLEDGFGLPFQVIGRPLEAGARFHGGGGWQSLSHGFFETFRIPVIRGRSFDERDGAGAPPVVIINQEMARRYWPKSDPLADRILIGKGMMSELATEQPRQIVGIVGDVRGNGLHENPGPVMYVPQGQITDAINALNLRIGPIAWVIRTKGDPARAAGPVREALREASGLPVAQIRTMEEVLRRSTSRHRFRMLLMSVFGVTALALAALGVYGLMAYSVEQRTREIGILMALGAETSSVQRRFLWEGMRLALPAIAVGVAGAFGLARFVSAFLYGVTQRDPAVFVAVPVLLSLAALAAVWLPAVRATRVDPVEALRAD